MTTTRHGSTAEAEVADRKQSANRLQRLADELLLEVATRTSRQATRMVPDPVSGLRQTLIALAGADFADTTSAGHDGSVHVMRGTVRLVTGEQCVELRTHDYASLPSGPHVLSAAEAAVILHSVVVVAPEAPPQISSAAQSVGSTR